MPEGSVASGTPSGYGVLAGTVEVVTEGPNVVVVVEVESMVGGVRG
jgi:hypothetical protein